MSKVIPIAAALYFVLMTLALTFPGISIANNIQPLVFGLPFVFAWNLGWVAISIVVFAALYRVYHK